MTPTFSMPSFLELYDELVIGRTKEFTWVIDREPGKGILGTVDSLSAEEASRAVTDGGSTVAAHTEHIRWSLNYALTFLEGKTPSGNWEESWRIKTVDEKEWANLRQDLKQVYKEIRQNIEHRTAWTDSLLLTGLMAVLPHLGYHLGAIRQMMVVLKLHKS